MSSLPLVVALIVGSVIVGALRNKLRAWLLDTLMQRGLLGLLIWGLGLAFALGLIQGDTSPWIWGAATAALVGAALIYLRQKQGSSRARLGLARRDQNAAHLSRDGPQSTSRAQLGPNANEVRLFLTAIAQLTDEQWGRILADAEYDTVRSVRRLVDLGGGARLNRQLDAAGREAERFEALHALEAALKAGDDHTGDRSSLRDRRYVAAAPVVEALVVRDLIQANHFDSVYSPFSPIIPESRIGLGHERLLKPPS